MLPKVFIWLGFSCFCVGAQNPVSSCQDLDTSGCLLLQKTKPDICQNSDVAQGPCRRLCGTCPLECYSCPFPTTDPTECRETMPCDPKTRCVRKQLTAKDGHTEYIYSCERYEICEGLTSGFGKRELVDVNEIDPIERQRFERNVGVFCCNSDFCNRPNQTTSTLTTTTATTTAINSGTNTSSIERECYRDIVFVVDDSVSVGKFNFKHAMDFIHTLVSKINVGPSQAQIAVMTYSTDIKIEWYLNTYSSQSDVMAALNNVTFNNGLTYTGAALKAVRTEILTHHHGDRRHVDNAVIVITDGVSNNRSEILQQAKALHAITKDVVGIMTGKYTNPVQMNYIATDSNHVIDVHDYQHLHRILLRVLNLICS